MWPRRRPGDFSLDPGSPGFDAGVRLPNFNDHFRGRAPDIGAFEAGSAPMEFGVNAYPRVPEPTPILNLGHGRALLNRTPKYLARIRLNRREEARPDHCCLSLRERAQAVPETRPFRGAKVDDGSSRR